MSDRAPAGAPLPVGTVTFVFTDIEGSTRLVATLGDRWEPLLQRHRVLVRAALAENAGFEVQTEGDGFFLVFPRVGSALAFARDVQRAFAAEPWPENARLRVRAGLHVGTGVLDADGSYVGGDVHRAARVAGAAHGGQVLLSETAAALAAGATPAGVAIHDLGEHRLKDLRPERLAALEIEGLASDFPPIRALDARPNNLPSQLTSFVGRERELEDAVALLDQARLLTLTGPGGTGKTRLALQIAAVVADRFPDGVWFVALEPIRERRLVGAAIARTLGLADSSTRSPLDAIAEHIADRAVLLVLDNFEQVIEAAPDAADILRRCPGARLVVTSRASLHVAGEQEYPVPGLPTPPDMRHLSAIEAARLPSAARRTDPAALSQYEAVRLFIARAVAVRPDFAVTNENAPAVAAICSRLQGMPLAIELAAARVKVLSPDAILARLEDRLGLLASTARDVPERQRTLRGAIAWSYDLLEPPERRLLDRLAAFVGGADLQMAETVCDPTGELGIDLLDGLASLVDRSLVRAVDADGTSRFVLLDTIRSFALEQLDAGGEAEATRRRHLGAFLALAEEAAPHLAGSGQRHWLDRLDADHDNLRAALELAEALPDPPAAVRLGFALWRFWQQRGYLNEARARLGRIADRGWPLEPRLRARLCEALGGLAYWQADHEVSRRWYREALAIWRTQDDPGELANALYNASTGSIVKLAAREFDSDEVHQAERQLDEAEQLYADLGDRVGLGNVAWARGNLDYFQGRNLAAESWFVRSLEHFRATGQRTMEAWALHMTGTAVLKEGRVDDAETMIGHALRHFHDSGDVSGITLSLDDLSAVAVARGDLPRAARLRGAARQLTASTGTDLASYVDELFEETSRPNAARVMAADELERYGAQGAALPLDDAVAYALGTREPFAG